MTYRSAKLKNRLTRCFKERFSCHRPLNQNQSEIVYGSHVKTGEVVETVFMSTTSIDEEQLANSDSEADLTNTQEEVSRQVYHTAKTIQKLVANMKPTMSWPPSSEDLESESAIVPDLLYNMMAWILSTQSEYSAERVSNISPDVNRPALSLSQDLIHSVSRGRIKTPKHIVLPMTVKSLTGNVELITILNTFGHGLSIILPSRGSGDSSGGDADCEATEWGLGTLMYQLYSAGTTTTYKRKHCQVKFSPN